LRESPDLVCLPEAFTARGVPTRSVADVAETVPGPTTDCFAALARRHRCYILCPIYTKREGVFRNSAVVIDRQGSIAGIYDKRRPCASSRDFTVFEEGIAPGEEPGIFDLDFGRVGIRICMDIHFSEDWILLSEMGAKAVFWPSAYDGRTMLQSQAILHYQYLISSVRTGRSRVVNPCGRVIAESTPSRAYTTAEINLDYVVAREEFNAGVPDAIARKYGAEVTVRHYPEDGLFLVEPEGALTAKELRAEFNFQSAADFVEQHRQAYRRLLLGCRQGP